jgi:hypothetical protein
MSNLSGNKSFSGFIIYENSNTFSISDDWTLIVKGKPLTNYTSSITDTLGDSNVTIAKYNDNLTETLSITDNIQTSIISLSSHIQTNIINLSKTFTLKLKSLSNTFFGTANNLSGQYNRTLQTMSGNLPLPPPPSGSSSSSSSVTSMNQNSGERQLTVSSGYNLKITNGNMIVNATSYGMPSLATTDNTSYTWHNSTIQTTSGGFHTSPSSMYLNRGYNALRFGMNAPDAAALTRSGTYTVEFFFKQLSGVPNQHNFVYASRSNNTGDMIPKFLHGAFIDPNNNNKMGFSIGNGSTWTASGVSTQTIVRDTWYHFAFQKTTTNTFEYFLNGKKEATLINTTAGTTAMEGYIHQHLFGSQHPTGTTSSGNSFIGYIDTLRLSNIARYSGSNYTIPSFTNSTDRYTLDPFTVYVNYFSLGVNNSQTFNGSGNQAFLYAASLPNYGNFQLKKLKNAYTNYTAYVDSNGNVNRSASDERLKTYITPITSTLDKIHALNPVQFKWKDSDCLDWGFIAQQVQRDFESGLVFQNINGYLGLHITKLIPFLVKGVQELSAKLDLLKQKYNVV